MNYSQLDPILIVEDNLIDALILQQSVENLGFQNIRMASSIAMATTILTQHKPSLILCDLFFDKKPKALDLLRQFSDQCRNFIIVTNCEEVELYDEAKAMGVGGHLIKPFHQLSLRSLIDHVLTPSSVDPVLPTPYLFIRGTANKQVRIHFTDILYFYSERNYISVKTIDKLYTIKRSLTKMQEELDDRFVRVHNSYIVNTDHLKSIAASTLIIHKDILPLGRAYRKTLIDKLKVTRHKEVS